MKILMLNPPFLPLYSRSSRSPAVTKGGTFYYPFYLAYATGVLEKNGFNVKLIDAVARKWSHDDTIKFVKKNNFDFVIVDTSTPSIYNDVQIAEKIKLELNNVHISLVGTHVTHLPKETLKLSNFIDSVCRGEYDYTILDMARNLEKNKSLNDVDGISFRDGKRIKNNKTRKLIQNLDELPFVSEIYKKHLNVKDYFYASVTYPEVTVLTARGCPYSCSFCNIPFKSSYRSRSPENVIEEFEYIQKELPEVKEVMIEDDTFPVSKNRTLEICDLLIKKKINLKWSCNARVNTDFETLKKMKESGCRLLCVGFETPEQKVLDEVHKKTTKDLQIKFIKNTKKLGLLVNGCFVLGLPNDTKQTIRRTIEFAKELNPDTVQFYPIMVYPGTEAYDWAKKNNYLITEDYSKWLTPEGLHNTTVSRPNLSNTNLLELCDEARREFYLRSTYIFYKLKQLLTNSSEIQRTSKAFKIFFWYLIKKHSYET